MRQYEHFEKQYEKKVFPKTEEQLKRIHEAVAHSRQASREQVEALEEQLSAEAEALQAGR